LNDHVKLVAEYNVNKITVGTVAGEPEEETDTIALGAIISF
ncbi:MAG: porin, partial [Deltaproteobacteria bacterium]|nr:porin [Deltaproteobacteria bacterium]